MGMGIDRDEDERGWRWEGKEVIYTVLGGWSWWY
jgi:hypothetical protein